MPQIVEVLKHVYEIIEEPSLGASVENRSKDFSWPTISESYRASSRRQRPSPRKDSRTSGNTNSKYKNSKKGKKNFDLSKLKEKDL